MSTSIGVVAIGINSLTYYSALGMSIRSLRKGKHTSNKVILRNRGRRILIINKVSIIRTYNLVRLNKQYKQL